ncbi:MAG: glycosyltransferase [Gammaproteobacteria bacterium]|nr:glycosyltransferase [Gammaproteobacteria bacterium]MDH3505694.1 glycosyltransferase [Gammaproteobacteria bacterium]
MNGLQRAAGCLVLCCKAPQRSKRRLASALGDGAATAAEHLLACALEDLVAWPGEAVIAPASDQDAEWFHAGLGRRFETFVQRGSSLGARINHVDAVLRSCGRERLIYIGADCPALDPAYLASADRALDDNDAVIGPATDGGVVLMGARRPWPDIGDLAWSTPQLREDLCARLRMQGWLIANLETLADVDTIEDLTAASDGLVSDERCARRALVDWLRSSELLEAAIS